MKKHIPALLLFLALFVSSSLHSQSPLGIPYQAVMRNADGSVMASSTINITFMIHDGTANGAVVYQESHSLTSNAQGLVTCVVGNGVVSEGNFININWGSGAKFLHVLMNGNDLGTQQMLSVPYALYAGACDIQVSLTGDTLYTGGGNFVIIPGISAANFPPAILGCTDNAACNYNSAATQNDNSCLYTGATCDDGNANTTNDVINGSCICAGVLGNYSGPGSELLPEIGACQNEMIHVFGCNGAQDLTYSMRDYDLVEVGGQCWFSQNLATWQYANGDQIYFGPNNMWPTSAQPATSIYNDTTYNTVYGNLYNWYAVNDTRGLCPSGWKIPSDCDWMYFENTLGVPVVSIPQTGSRGSNQGGKLKAISGWSSPNFGANNEIGFNGIGAGTITTVGTSVDLGNNLTLWTSSAAGSSLAWIRRLSYNLSTINRQSFNKGYGFSVRCMKASASPLVSGCTIGGACNYNPLANDDDGTCIFTNGVCNDGNSNTTMDKINAQCTCVGVPVVLGCTDEVAVNYNSLANEDDGTCIIAGCLDNTACNYNSAATQNDNSCLYLNATCDDGNANTINDVINGSCECSGTAIVNGCTNTQACNYNPAANVDNGSCLIQGAACNDNNANTANDVINGSCVCAGTAVGNGTYVPGNGATDIDGNTYTSIIINGQEWMQQNLAVTKYRNGDPIPTGLSDATWFSTTSGAYAIYNNDAANNTLYGKLYNGYAVNDSRGLCPTGWHVPSDAEWTTLETNLGGSSVAGGKMKSTTGWTSPNTGATNSSGFTAFPGGYRTNNGPYSNVGDNGFWWSSTEYDSNFAWNRRLVYYSSFVNRNDYGKRYGFSVRCVRD